MFLFFILLTIVSFASIKFITPIPKTTQLEFHCNDGISDLRYSPETIDYCGTERLKNGTNSGADIKFDVSGKDFIARHFDFGLIVNRMKI